MIVQMEIGSKNYILSILKTIKRKNLFNNKNESAKLTLGNKIQLIFST